MITDYFISPHPWLQLYVETYILSTSHQQREAFGNHWPASPETSLVFNLADEPLYTNLPQQAAALRKSHCLIGPQTRPNGLVQFEGSYRTFIVQLKANGLPGLFNLRAQEVRDDILCTTSVLGSKADTLYEQLRNANNVHEMALFSDQFLLAFLRGRSKVPTGQEQIASMVDCFCYTNHVFPVSQLAGMANMSVRNFERRFSEQVGISPKLYTKLVRFNHAMSLKIASPQKHWTAIAHECGYYDQMHFIKDFRQFAGLTPRQYFGQHQTASMPQVNFVRVQRAIF